MKPKIENRAMQAILRYGETRQEVERLTDEIAFELGQCPQEADYPKRPHLIEAYTATTTGFGELPVPFTDAQRMWATVSLYAGVIAWLGIERWRSGKASALGGASGAIAGLVAITPAAGTSGFAAGAVLGASGALACYGFVGSLKNKLRLDDSLDAFGIHGVAGIVGSVGTAVVSAPSLGGFASALDYSIGHQLGVQLAAVAIAIAWSALGSILCFGLVRVAIGLRVDHDSEREGLDLTQHGERAYAH